MRRLAFFALLVLSVLVFSPMQSRPVHAQNAITDNFVIDTYLIDYTLDRDDTGHSTLATTETITVIFPQTDQNHGIERAIPNIYDGHSTHLSIQSVNNELGQPLNYTTYQSNGNTVVRIGQADRYVQGLHTYKIVYVQQDVTKNFAGGTPHDEFYWDTNGTEWRVPINSLKVNLKMSDQLVTALNGNSACYAGVSQSTESCQLVKSGATFSTSANNLQPKENITIAIGFLPQTFAVYKATFAEKLMMAWAVLLPITIGLSLIILFWIYMRYVKITYRTRLIGTIIPEYLPPKNISVSTAATIMQKPNRIFSAQIIDLAVRHYLKIYQISEKSFFTPAKFELEITKDITTLLDEEKELLNDIFSTTSVGSRLDMSSLKSNYSVGTKLNDNPGKLNKLIETIYGLRAKDPTQSIWFRRAAFILAIASIVTLSPGFVFCAIITLILSFTLKPLTDKGVELTRYMKGLELYIKVAESERLQMLQSPEGAAKIGAPIDTNDNRQLLTLYERVLPYAILFGQEKQWNQQLGRYYESTQQSPSWYAGNSQLFNAAVFASAVSAFNQSATYSVPSNSISSGSGGGGSSGGGGGGGGGGGW